MGIDLDKYASEVLDFLCTDTMYEIDCGTLDLGCIRDVELREFFRYMEELLYVELLLNYMQSATGIFRVHLFGDVWCYCEGQCVITAESLCELRQSVISQNGIWYVFDETLARRTGGWQYERREI